MAADGASFTTKKSGDPIVHSDVAAQLEQARADMKALADLAGQTAADTARDVSAYAESAVADISDDARQLYAEARARAAQGVERVEATAKQNPMLFAGGALALGVIIGAALRK